MNTLNRLIPACLALLLGACASQLTVRTEVHTGEGLENPKSFAETVSERARATREALRTLQTDVAIMPTDRFGAAISSFSRLLPARVAGTPDEFRQNYRDRFKDLTRPLNGEMERLIEKTKQIEASAAARPTSEELRVALSTLQADLAQLSDALQVRLNRVREDQQRLHTSTIDKNYPPMAQLRKSMDEALKSTIPDAAARAQDVESRMKARYEELASATGLPVTTDSERREAIEFLDRQIRIEGTDAADLIGRSLLTPLRQAESQIAGALIISLSDPNVPRIVGEGAEYDRFWRKYVNDVTSTNVLGNAETAFRMEGLGESHIKSVIFDPSEVTKIGLSVFSNTLRITAAAYGMPLPTSNSTTASTTTTTTDTTATATGTATAAASASMSKPAIDAEVGQLGADRAIRGQKMETLFWKTASAQASLGADGTAAAAAEVVKTIADQIECLAAEIEKPQTKKCGGTS